MPGATPDSLIALHDAGYRELAARLGPGLVLDVGCGTGFETVKLTGPGRVVVGVDYDPATAAGARSQWRQAGLLTACMDGGRLGLATASFDWVCSSHLVEHFVRPADHVGELARVLKDDGSLLLVTPNRPADFENPFHVALMEREELAALLSGSFGEVWVGGLDGTPAVKADFGNRRARAQRILALDVFDLRHRIPHRWYVGLYTRVLPLAYRLMARRDSGGHSGITAEDFFVTDEVDHTTVALLAVARRPRR
ncbi:MAG TPA: class I SAM-dependent methyltransferase [Acidimicrobiales bacterium]|nr:class I SAM-dependent methyltransferase [Acidimicrobiales bacterium]